MLGKLKIISIEKSLSARLLLLTIFSVLTVEIFFYVPSIANFRLTWIEQKLAEAHIAIMVVEAAPDFMVSRLLTDQLLASSENYSIIRQFQDGEQQALMAVQPFEVSKQVDIRDVSWFQSIKDALDTMVNVNRTGFLIEARGNTVGDESEEIIIVFNEQLLCADMLDYSLNILVISVIISVFVGMFLYYNLSRQLVQPVEKITDNLIAFRNAPEDMTKRFEPDDRKDEIGVVMRELATMQDEVRKALNQKDHLAKLGGAISNINHDLRNMLSSAQLVSDHLSTIDDPIVQQLAPRFVKAIDRAIRLCEHTLEYGGAKSEELNIRTFNLHNLVADVSTSLGLFDQNKVVLHNKVDIDQKLTADNDQIFRVLMNICRNAIQAIGESGNITVSSVQSDNQITIDITDDALGIPEKIKENLFQPFKTGSRGGTGLGLAISKEIITAHGGTLDLLESSPNGSTFRIVLPIHH